MKKILNALFVALLAVFTFSSCSDVPAPYEILEPGSGNQGGMQGGDAANPFGLDASNPVNDFSADFEEQPDFTPDGKFDSNLNYDYELVGWKNVAEVGDRKWTGVVFKSGEKYLRASSNKGKEASYTSWFISPAFNVEQIKDKTVSFDCAGAFFYQTTTLKVYFLEMVDGVMKKTPLAVNGIPTSGENYKWVKGINVDLKDFAGKVGFIGFEYVGEGGEKKSTTYTLDNIKCGKSDSQPVDPQPEVPGEEVVVTKDAAYEESFASEFGKFTVEDKELGGLNFVWTIDAQRHNAKGSAFKGSAVVAESWLVSPVLNLNALTKVALNFSQASYSAGQKEEFMLKVKNVTDNVDWANVDFELTEGQWKWIDNTVDLSAYAGKKIQIAFAYKNDNTAKANTWNLKNVKVSDGQGGGTVEPEPQPQPGDKVYTSNIKLPESDKGDANKAAGGVVIVAGKEYPILKLGTGKAVGSWSSAALKAGSTKLSFYAVGWTGKTGTLTVTIENGGSFEGGEKSQNIALDGTTQGATQNSPFTITPADGDFHEFTLTGITASSTIKFSTENAKSDKRAIVFGVNVK